MKRSTCFYVIILLTVLLVSCSGFNSQVKCPKPGKTGKRYAKLFHWNNFRVGNKTVNSAYRSFYKKGTPVSNGNNLSPRNNQIEGALLSRAPGFNNIGGKFTVANSALLHSGNSDKQNIFRVIPNENLNEIKPEITKHEFRKVIKTEVKSLRKEYMELNKFQSSGRKASGFSTASFVLGMVGTIPVLALGLPFGILAILFGVIALARYKKNPEEKLKGLAIAGIIIGIIDIYFGIITLMSLI